MIIPIYVKAKNPGTDFDLTGELIKEITKGKKEKYDAYSSAAKAIIEEKELPNYYFRIEKVGGEKKVYCYKKNM